jgi:hypothetical protein
MLSKYITLLAGAFALTSSALPTTSQDDNTPRYFSLTKFNYGYSAPTGGFLFDVTVHGAAQNHPEILTPVTCQGSVPSDTYFTCSSISTTQSINAYIDAADILHLSYSVQAPDGDFTYFGTKKVYSQTGPKASKQKSEFIVKESAGIV